MFYRVHTYRDFHTYILTLCICHLRKEKFTICITICKIKFKKQLKVTEH